jgi:Na+-transporting NADH:ubiquinone oxidoreductase subunit NqrE
MGELFPVVSGVVLGIVVAGLRPSLRLWVGALLSAVLGLCATVLSGEFEVSWDYLLVDIPLVAVSAGAAFTLARTAFLRLRQPIPR